MPDSCFRTADRPAPDHGTGYAHRDYAASLAEFGDPLELPASGGWLLSRAIPGSGFRDLMGCYPIFSCADWSGLASDLAELGRAPSDESPLCVSMVVDPFSGSDAEELAVSFPDLCRPFKQHFVVDLDGDIEAAIGSTHRRNVRKALRDLTVEPVEDPAAELDVWHDLYGDLIRRHGITGISAFSKAGFARQLATPGITAFRARHAGETVGMVLFYTQGERAYYHLAAYSETGYRLRASFAIFWTAIHEFRGRLDWLSLGASAGVGGDAEDGLSRFKRGWSTGTRTAYLCGRILHPSNYRKLVSERSAGSTTFFPAYRAGEFS